MMKWIYFTTVIFCGIVMECTIANIDSNNGLPNLQNIQSIGELPTNLTSKIPTPEDADRMFAEKCRKHGGEEAYAKAKKASEEAKDCVTNLLNVTMMSQEIEAATPTGDLDIVFKKYCRKAPLIKECILNFTSVAESCFHETELENEKVIKDVADSLLNFVCFKEGDRIALFIAEGGPECLKSKTEDIKNCLNVTLSKFVPKEMPSIDEIPTFLIQLEQCQDFLNVQKCIVTELEKCEEPTPANIVDSMFNFVRKVTPCAGYKPPSDNVGVADKINNGVRLVTSITSLLLSYLTVRYII